MRADARGGAAGAGPRKLLDEHGVVQVVAALSAVFARVLQPEQALGGELRTPRPGNQRSSSHACACGVSSRSMKPRIEERSSSCSAVNGGVGLLMSGAVPIGACAYRPYGACTVRGRAACGPAST